MVRVRNSNLCGRITIFLIGCCCCLSARGQYGGGTGEPNNPYLIYAANEMNAIGADANDWDKHFKLMADIDIGAFDGKDGREKFNIIGEYFHAPRGILIDKPFSGVFDGNGHTISNFIYDANDTDYIGLFQNISHGEVRNLCLVDPNIHGGTGKAIGALAGRSLGVITNCYARGGSVSGEDSVGGLVGYCGWNTITGCYSTTSVTGGNSVGGLVGDGSHAAIITSYATGEILGDHSVGGLIGLSERVVLINCYSAGSVTGQDYVGGLSGHASGPRGFSGLEVIDCYSTGRIVGTGRTGGLSGGFGAYPTNSYWDIQSGGEPNMCGEDRFGGCDDTYGRTTLQMQQQSTFEGWDFINVWAIGENQTYPYLRTVSAGDINKDRIVNFLDLCILGEEWMKEE